LFVFFLFFVGVVRVGGFVALVRLFLVIVGRRSGRRFFGGLGLVLLAAKSPKRQQQ